MVGAANCPGRAYIMAFTAKFTLDLNSASGRAFNTLLDDFETWRATQDPRELDLTNGWKTITQEIAEAMLLRNPIGANRRPTLPTIKYYARQMVNKEWKKTTPSRSFAMSQNTKIYGLAHA